MFKLNLKQLLILFLGSICSNQVISQTVLLSEDFSTASGSTPPAGWTVQTTVGDPVVDVWRFDNPGRRIPNAPIAGNFACFDSDRYSDNNLAEEVYLVSPVFDGRTTDNFFVEIHHFFVGGFDGICTIEVFNGTEWITIYTNSETTTNPRYDTFDISSNVFNVSNAQIRFKWVGNFSYFWIIDNVRIVSYPPYQKFIEQLGIILQEVHDGDVAWGDINNDGDLDLLITGDKGPYNIAQPFSQMYSNIEGNFFTNSYVVLPNVQEGSVVFRDYNNDGYIDLFISGAIGRNWSNGLITKVFKNDGSGFFAEVTSINLPGFAKGFIDLADYDNDGDYDLLIGGSNTIENFAKLFRNNGNDIFEEQTHIVLPYASSGGWFDCNNDGLFDIFLGNKIFKNNGDNTFTEQTKHNNIILLWNESICFCDFDNDGDTDILMIGKEGPISRTYLYKYNSAIDYYERSTFNLPSFDFGSCSWADLNNDGYPDLMLSGNNVPTRIFYNQGGNSFEEQSFNLPYASESTARFGDFDNDGDLDIIIIGYGGSKIFKNNSSSHFPAPAIPEIIETLVNNNQATLKWSPLVDEFDIPIKGITYNIKIGTASGGQDVKSSNSLSNGKRLIPDIGNALNKTSYTIKNLKPGTYYWSVQAVDAGLRGGEFSSEGQFDIISNYQASLLYASSIAGRSLSLSWTRGSGNQCIVFAKEGIGESYVPQNGITYSPNSVFGMGSQIGETGWYCVYKGSASYMNLFNLKLSTDYSFQVFEFNGTEGNEIYNTILDKNTASCQTGIFKYLHENKSTGATEASIALLDFDSDGSLDVAINSFANSSLYKSIRDFYLNKISYSSRGGQNGSIACSDFNNDNCMDIFKSGHMSSSIYNLQKNNCNGTFSFEPYPNLTITGSCFSWGDYNNNGLQDVFFSGGGVSTLYVNKGGFFEKDTINFFPGLWSPSFAWGDFNNDMYLDLILTGYNGNKTISIVYENMGNGLLTARDDFFIKGVQNGSVAWGDYNNDGKLDLLITGNDGNSNISAVYKNTGIGFEEQNQINLIGVSNGTAVWGDFNNDNFLDILISGDNIFKQYFNEGDGNFIEEFVVPFHNRPRCKFTVGDLDNDGDLDVLSIGNDYSLIRIYENEINTPSIISTPQNLRVQYAINTIVLQWDPASTNSNIENAYTYNVEIWTNDSIYCPSLSNTNGSRKVISMGNAQNNNSYLIKDLPLGTYYWRVQAIDNRYIGGEWSEVKSFSVKKLRAGFIADNVCIGDSTSFIDNSIKVGLVLDEFKWDFGDATESSLEKPKHVYQNIGNYTVKYIVKSENFIDSVFQTVIVKERPTAIFNIQNACEGDNVQFIDNSTVQNINLSQWHWNLGDGKQSTLQNPLPNTYLRGNYKVKLTAYADNGCWDTITKPLTVVPYPNATLSLEYGEPNFCFGDSTCYSAIYNNNWDYQWQLNNENISERNNTIKIKSRQGDYRVIISHKVVNTCIDTSTQKTITIIAPPPTPIIKETNNKTLFCMGEDVELLIDNFSSSHSYQWKRFGANIDNATGEYLKGKLAAGDYTVQASTEFCHVLSNKLTLTNKPALPKPTVLGQGPTIWTLACDNMTARGYRWYFNNNLITDANGYQYYANKNYGDYYVTVNDGGECWTPSDVFRTSVANNVDALTDEKVKIYPNPSEGIFNVSLGVDIAGVVNVRIVDVLGKVVFSQNYNTSDFPVDISQVTKGIYYFSIMYKNEIIIKKVVKQ